MPDTSTSPQTAAPRVALACDHAGFALKEHLKAYLQGKGVAVTDLGTHSDARVDYPDFGAKLAQAVLADPALAGLGICGTGIGISIALNRFKGVRAALCHDVTSAKLSREHNNANVLCLGARIIGEVTAEDCIDAFLATAFAGGRHQGRIDKLETLG